MRAHSSHALETFDRPAPWAGALHITIKAACLCLALLFGLPFQGATPKTTVLMIQWRGETPAEKGFMDELQRTVAGIEFVTFDADQDKDRLLNYLRGEFTGKARRFDYVYSFGTTASEMVRRVLATVNAKGIVHIINIVADPVTAKLADSLSAAGGNRIVGCHLVPLETQLRNARRIVAFTRIGLIFNPREENANIQLQQLTDLSVRMGFAVVPVRIRPEKEDLENALRRIAEKEIDVDCVYLHSESFLVSNAKLVVKRLNEARIPTITAVEPFMQEGALTGTIASYHKLGQLVARAVVKDIKNPRATHNGPVIFDPNPEFILNTTTAASLGIKVDGIAGVKFIK